MGNRHDFSCYYKFHVGVEQEVERPLPTPFIKNDFFKFSTPVLQKSNNKLFIFQKPRANTVISTNLAEYD